MANAWHPDASGEDSRLLAQVLTVLQRLQPPDSRLSSWDLPGRLQQARMQGIGALIGSATRKLRDARPLAATPCELQLLDAALDILVGAYFLNCLNAPAGQPTGGKEMPAPLSPASPAPAQATWSNQHYYRFMEEIATRLANGTPAGKAASVPVAGHPPTAAQAYTVQLQDTPTPDDQDSSGKLPACAMQSASPQTQHGMRPYSRMARLRRAAGQAAAPAPTPVAPATTAAPAAPAAPAVLAAAPPCSPTTASGEASDRTNRQAQYRREAEGQAWADYLAQAGKAIYAGMVLTETGAITLARPMLFTVLAGATMETVCQWQESRLRPVWQVRPVGALPGSLKQQAHLWIYGHEYDDAGRFFASSFFTPALPAGATLTPTPLPATPGAPAVASRAAVEAQALREYEAHLGQVLEVQELCAQVGTLGDEIIHCVPPATVRVVQTRPDYLLQWRNNELRSQWQVEAVTPHSGLARASQLRIPGPAWQASGERIGWPPVERPI